jgi:hypothetical protein
MVVRLLTAVVARVRLLPAVFALVRRLPAVAAAFALGCAVAVAAAAELAPALDRIVVPAPGETPAPLKATAPLPATEGAPAAAQHATREWRFAVSLDAIPIGEHRYVVADAGAAHTVTVDARFRVHLLLVDAYSWQQHVDETWHGDCLARLSSRTVEQGRVTTVAGQAGGDGFVVQGPQGKAVVEGCAMTFAYWNPQVLHERELINVQTGVPTPVEVERLGDDTHTVRGQPLPTLHWRLRTPRNVIELWYSHDGDWVGMRTTTRGGHVLTYRLV